ncbi:glycosyl transferase family 2 [Flavobacterium crocinum]|uniref:Glycosyl transferase family 2 n=1 Tax=Flavobacterium crocinum TaxID=2183896 RepID=A0A2S1YTZ8_9FLAO|nr:glycosyl transferase family 2 [Flavobacterium crocinum]
MDYVRKTLESIYSDANYSKVSLDDFEVILSDNDPNREIECLLIEFPFENFFYFNTQCDGFLNSYFVLAYGKGEFLKLHNSQEIFQKGSLLNMIGFIKTFNKSRPSIFFTSGFLGNGRIINYDRFDDFMSNLSYWSSWSNGFGIWREDFDMIKGKTKMNTLFPHTSLFLTQYNKKAFVINDEPLFKTQFVKKRGGHNKFQAFSIEYPSLIQSSYDNKQISLETKKKIFKDVLYNYLPLLYFNVKIARRETFSSDAFKKNIQVYFSKRSYWIVCSLSLFIPIKIILRKIKINYFIKSK